LDQEGGFLMAGLDKEQLSDIESGPGASAAVDGGVIISSRDERELGRLFWLLEGQQDVGERLATISAEWLGRPYIENSLDPPGGRESLRVQLQGFDCVTLIETALAVSLSDDTAGFIGALRQIRYQDAIVEWPNRNHYMTDWVANNLARGILRDLTTGQATMEKITALDVVEGLPPKLTAFRYFPQANLKSIKRRVQTGDIACFAAVRPGLDVFHTGILIGSDGAIILRHASRSAGAVVDQDLDRFVAENKMLGLILVRPVIPACVRLTG
jgi:hypothetical protein